MGSQSRPPVSRPSESAVDARPTGWRMDHCETNNGVCSLLPREGAVWSREIKRSGASCPLPAGRPGCCGPCRPGPPPVSPSVPFLQPPGSRLPRQLLRKSKDRLHENHLLPAPPHLHRARRPLRGMRHVPWDMPLMHSMRGFTGASQSCPRATHPASGAQLKLKFCPPLPRASGAAVISGRTVGVGPLLSFSGAGN